MSVTLWVIAARESSRRFYVCFRRFRADYYITGLMWSLATNIDIQYISISMATNELQFKHMQSVSNTDCESGQVFDKLSSLSRPILSAPGGAIPKSLVTFKILVCGLLDVIWSSSLACNDILAALRYDVLLSMPFTSLIFCKCAVAFCLSPFKKLFGVTDFYWI